MMTRDMSAEDADDTGGRRAPRRAATKRTGSSLQKLRDLRNGGNIANLELMEDDGDLDLDGYDEYKELYGDDANNPPKRRRTNDAASRKDAPAPQSQRISTMFQTASARGPSAISKLAAPRAPAPESAPEEGNLLSSLLADLHANPLGTVAAAPSAWATDVPMPPAHVSPFEAPVAPSLPAPVAQPRTQAIPPAPVAVAKDESSPVRAPAASRTPAVQPQPAPTPSPAHPATLDVSTSMPPPAVAPTAMPLPPAPADVKPADLKLDIKPSVSSDALLSPPPMQCAALPLMKTEEGEEVLRMYWIDAVEEPFGSPGVVFLFGKVLAENRFASVCVSVPNIQRTLFFQPREKRLEGESETDEAVEVGDVYEEVQGLMNKHRIPRFLSKPVERKYVFDQDGSGPVTRTYLKVKYSSDYPPLPEASGATFSRVFGANRSGLEQFLMKRDLMGPAWIEIRNVRQSNRPISWCAFDAVVEDMKCVRKCVEQPKPPPLVVLSLSLKTVLNQKHHRNEVANVSYAVHRSVEVDGPTPNPERDLGIRTAICKLDGIDFPLDFTDALRAAGREAETCANERALLSILLARIHLIDPDVVVGHNILGFDLSVLLHRMAELKVPHWSKLGRLRRSTMPKHTAAGNAEASFQERAVLGGRLICDMYNTSRDLIRGKSHSLSELAQTQLGVDRQEVDAERIPHFYSNSGDLIRLIEHSERDAQLCLALCHRLLVLPLTKQLTCLAGNVWSRTLIGGRAERNEHLLLHEFHRRKFICPDKQSSRKAAIVDEPEGDDADDDDGSPTTSGGKKRQKKEGRRRKAAYAGGLVLEPKRGFYDKFVIMLDFNSLYPSIIQEYNICFTTVAPPAVDATTGEVLRPAELPESDAEQGVLPKILATLVERRRQVKSLIKGESDPQRLQQLDIRQRALKLTANSMYGCLGFQSSRFHAKHLAEMITLRGRDTLQKTVDLAEGSLSLNVIYGDTDSVMIATLTDDLADAKKMGIALKKEVNKLYRHLEIELDGVFRTMLLLKKKKYAALVVSEADGKVTTHKETKGLDIVRRDWCELSHDVGNYILNQILSETARENLVEHIHTYLQQVSEDVLAGRVSLDKFVINKGLTKAPEDYPDRKSLPHVQVALKMKAKGRNVRPGDTVPYVICEGDDPSFAMRAHHPEEILKTPDVLKVDVKYYLRQQVHPVVSRLCEPIEALDAMSIAKSLGLDPSSYAKAVAAADDAPDVGETAEERFRTVDRWAVTCAACKWYGDFPGVFRVEQGKVSPGLLCPNCSAHLNATRLGNLAVLAIRSHIDRYYGGRLQCAEPVCGHSTRSVRVFGKGSLCDVDGCGGVVRREYTDAALVLQLQYLHFLFDVEASLKELDESLRADARILVQPYVADCAKVCGIIEAFLKRNERFIVSFPQLFEWMGTQTAPGAPVRG